MGIEAALDRIKAVVGPRGWIADPVECEPHLVEARRLWCGATSLVVRPASTAEGAAETDLRRFDRRCFSGSSP